MATRTKITAEKVNAERTKKQFYAHKITDDVYVMSVRLEDVRILLRSVHLQRCGGSIYMFVCAVRTHGVQCAPSFFALCIFDREKHSATAI